MARDTLPSGRTGRLEPECRAIPIWTAYGWLIGALLGGLVASVVLGASLPLLTVAWIAVALTTLKRTGSSASVGLTLPMPRVFAAYTLMATAAMTAVCLVSEATLHPYRELLTLVTETTYRDGSFAWVTPHSTPVRIVGFVLYCGLVTMFAEEAVFRGVMLNRLRRRGPVVAIAVTIPVLAHDSAEGSPPGLGVLTSTTVRPALPRAGWR